MLKIALLAPIPENYENTTSGVPRASLSLARSLKQYCVDLDIMIITLNNEISELKKYNTEFATFYYLPTFKNRLLFLYLQDVIRIRFFLKQIKPDVIHSQGFPEYILAGKFSGYPHVATIHGIISHEAKTERRPLKHFIRAIIRGVLEQYYVRTINDIISISGYVGRYVSSRSKARLHNIDNPVEERFFNLKDNSQKGFILQVGSVVHRKGAHLLIEAVIRIGKTKIRPQIHFAGNMIDTKYLEYLKKMIDDNKVNDCFYFHDSVSDAEMDELYCKAEIICLPSLEETSPISLAQAMAVGKTIVASNCGGIPDLIRHGETGLLFPAGSSEHLGIILEKILNGEFLKDDFGIKAKSEAMRRFHPRVVAEKTRDVYYALINSN